MEEQQKLKQLESKNLLNEVRYGNNTEQEFKEQRIREDNIILHCTCVQNNY